MLFPHHEILVLIAIAWGRKIMKAAMGILNTKDLHIQKKKVLRGVRGERNILRDPSNQVPMSSSTETPDALFIVVVKYQRIFRSARHLPQGTLHLPKEEL